VNADRWHNLEVRHLVALSAIAEEGTFASAAARLGYSQSAISQQIAALERIVGTPVLQRSPGRRPLGLTTAGELVLQHAGAMLARVQAAQADIETLSNGNAELRIGIYQSVGARILPAIMHRFREERPGSEVSLREAPGDAELLRLLEQAELDVTFAMLPTPEGPFEARQLLQDPYVLVVPMGSPLARRSTPPTLAEIASLPLIGFRSCRNEQRIEAHMHAQGANPSVVSRSDDNGTLQGLVAAGVGFALVPRLTMDPGDERTVLIDLDGQIPPRLLGLVRHRDRHHSPAAEDFARIAAAVCASLEQRWPRRAAQT
jgi:molybdate transport repressor ModE-like protein